MTLPGHTEGKRTKKPSIILLNFFTGSILLTVPWTEFFHFIGLLMTRAWNSCAGTQEITVPWNKRRVEKNATLYWTLSGVSRIYKHCIKP